MAPGNLGLSDLWEFPEIRVPITRILLFKGTILGSPIFGNSPVCLLEEVLKRDVGSRHLEITAGDNYSRQLKNGRVSFHMHV